MCAVLRNDLEWKEDSWDSSNYFIGKKVLDCKVYQDEDTNSESIWVAMTLANQNGQEETMKLVAHSGNDAMPQGHYIVHAFVSDPKSGCVVEEFPLHRNILGVTRVHREEKGRSWSCCGHSMDDGCYVSGLKFVLSASQNDTSELDVILHCWEQCKPLPFCGDPHSPSYHFFMASYADLTGKKKSSFLPPDFLAHIGHGDRFCPLDASGMLLAGTARGKALRYDLKIFSSVGKQLGVGQWTPGPFWQFRATHSGERLIQLLAPSERNAVGLFGLGLGGQMTVKWQEIFQNIWEKNPDLCTILHGTYESIEDICHLPPSRITSCELNAAVNLGKSPSLVIPASKAQQVLSKFLGALFGDRNPQPEAISVRFTEGMALGGLEPLGSRLLRPFRCRVQHGCQGGSLGFHLVESSEMRKVITLHGSVEDLISDLEQTCAGGELELCKGLIRDGKASTVLGMRNGIGYSGRLDQEVMSMRISNPFVHALMACSMVMPDGQVRYDTKTKAFYPVIWDGGNLRREAACALILEILKAMKACQTTAGSIPSVIHIKGIDFEVRCLFL